MTEPLVLMNSDVAACIRLVQDQARQNFSLEVGGLQAPNTSWGAIDSWYIPEEGMTVFFKGMVNYAPVEGSTPRGMWTVHIWYSEI